MEFIQGIENFNYNENTAVTIGKFDALHRGHRLLIENVVNKKKEGLKAVVIVFSVSPRIVIKKEEELKFIITDAERRGMLSGLNIDYLIELKFNEETRNTEPEDFVWQLTNTLNMKYLCVGEDFRFGHKGRGDVELIKNLKDTYGYEIEPVKKLEYKDDIISSTRIRSEISKGNLYDVNRMLGYNFFIEHKVVRGNRIGRTIEYPTINLIPTADKLLPPFGVYATTTRIGNREVYGMTNIGIRPTISEEEKRLSVETHLFNFNEDVYEKKVMVSFLKFIREEKKFSSIEELKKQIKTDEKDIKKLVNDNVL